MELLVNVTALLGLGILIVGIAMLFMRGKRKRGILMIVGTIVMMTVIANADLSRQAKERGFANVAEMRAADDHTKAKIKAEAVAKAKAEAADTAEAAKSDWRASLPDSVLNMPQHKLPSYAPAAPLAVCEDGEKRAICETRRIFMERRDWPPAWEGDINAQREVASCFRDGCKGAVQISKGEACAWRMVIVSTHKAKEVEENDFSDMRYDCGDLSEQTLGEAKVRALIIADAILSGQ